MSTQVELLTGLVNVAIPEVYQKGMSYYEVLTAVVNKVNDLIKQSNEYFSEDVQTVMTNILIGWKNDGTLAALLADSLLAIGDRTYTQQNYITNLETTTLSLDKLDIAVNLLNNEVVKVLNASHFNTLVDAVTALNTGTVKVLYIPETTYSISLPLTITADNTQIIMETGSIINVTDETKNAFIVTGENCTITGGLINYPAIFDGTNRKWENYEAAILVNGNGFFADNLRLNNVYKTGIGIRNASNCLIKNCIINGNYPSGSWTGVETAHFGIAIDPSTTNGGQNIIISNNLIKGCVQGVFVGSYGVDAGYGINISNNVFVGCHNHGIYATDGFGTVLNANSFNRCSYPIAIKGKNAIITNNNLYTTQTGNNLDLVSISVREASNCIITGNTIKGDGDSGGVIIDLTNLTEATIEKNIVSDNVIDILNMNNVVAIRVGTNPTEINKNNQIKNNIIKCRGVQFLGIISVSSKDGFIGVGNQVIGNSITILNRTYGIFTRHQDNMIIANNIISLEYLATSSEVVTMINAVNTNDNLIIGNSFHCKDTFGANVNLRGYLEDASSGYNFVTGNIIKINSPLVSANTPVGVQVTSKSSNNFINRSYTA